MENGSLSASDVALLSKGGFEGLGGGGGLIFIIAIVFLFMMLGNGNNGNNNLDQDINRGFDNQNLQAQTRDILAAVNNGTAQAVAATNQTFHDTFATTQNFYNELARDIANVQVAQAQAQANQNMCCCETKQMIMQSNYDAAMRDAATNANFTAQIQSVKDMMAQDKITAQAQRINALELQNALNGVVRYPTNTYYAVPSPCFGGCGCGCAA